MTLLLDTHSFLWFVLNDKRLSATATSLIANPNNVVYLSMASVWEIAIKVSLGKYTLPSGLEAFVSKQIVHNELTLLPITVEHCDVVSSLPFHHRDPFDRTLIAQSIIEGCPVLSSDSSFDLYQATRLW